MEMTRKHTASLPPRSGSHGEALMYQYGSPSGGTTEPNVVAQWLFDEASGNIVDEVASRSLTQVGSPTYRQNTSEYSSQMSLGIRCSPSATEAAFKIATPPTELNFGTSSGVIEWVARFDDVTGAGVGGATDGTFWDTRSGAAQSGINILLTSVNLATGGYQIQIIATDATTVTMNLTNPHAGAAPWISSIGVSHKWRLVVNRAANAQLFYDGVALGTPASLATLIGKSITSSAMGVATRYDTARPLDVTFNELRFTIGNITNNSGGPGNG